MITHNPWSLWCSKWQVSLYSTYEQTSWWMACSKCCVLTIARIFPALFEAQYGVTISTLDSHASTLEIISRLISVYIIWVLIYTLRY
jgi:hypothetical protein